MIRVVSDSSLDYSVEEKNLKITRVPFKIDLDDVTYVDDNKDYDKFLENMRKAETFKTSCPSTGDYLQAYEEDDSDIFCMTITKKLSGSYESAFLAQNLAEENNPKKKIFVIDTMAASTAMALIYERLCELSEKSFNFETIKENISKYVDEVRTLFVSESLENLRKAGRLSNVKAFFAKTLNIIPIMGAVDGKIEKISQARGKKKAFDKLVDTMGELKNNLKDKIVAISHCDNYERAVELKDKIIQRYKPKEVKIIKVSALNSMYVDYKGIIVSF